MIDGSEIVMYVWGSEIVMYVWGSEINSFLFHTSVVLGLVLGLK